MECGKKGGPNRPACSTTTDLCKNDDFRLALYTPYKMVAYTVWHAVQQKKEPPTPTTPSPAPRASSSGEGARDPNPLTARRLKRGGRVVAPVSQGRSTPAAAPFTFDFARGRQPPRSPRAGGPREDR